MLFRLALREKEDTTSLSLSEGAWSFIVENVTAQVCPQCGEEYPSPATVEIIRELIESKKKPLKTQEVPVCYLS